MKQIYLRLLKVGLPFLLTLAFQKAGYSQTCPDGSPQGGTAFDTTIAFGAGVVLTDVKFPKFDPSSGMVTCVKLCVTIKGVIDTVALENYSTGAQTGSYTYTRKDTIRGPGISTYLSSNANLSFGPFALAPKDGVAGSGPDFYSVGPDTVLTRVLCSNISDSTSIAQFYGVNDSVTYNYSIDADAIGAVTGGSAFTFVLSSAQVNFHFEYCTCPASVLPLNIREFSVSKLAPTKAELKWTGFDDPYANYHYEAEFSRNGRSFSSIGSFEKNTATNEPYKMLYTAPNGENGIYYFRIKQVYSNGYVRYSNISKVLLESSVSAKVSVYPNPSTGVVGIKFVNSSTGHFNIRIYNAQGQVVVNKAIAVSGSPYIEVANLKSGSYWLRLTDDKSQTSCVNQLLIK